MEAETPSRTDLNKIQVLLSTAHLPTQGVERLLETSRVYRLRDEIIATASLEISGKVALLRSIVVQPSWRNKGLAQQLISQLISDARDVGITSLYLLTETAQDYFARLGFMEIPRHGTPEPIRDSEEFRALCPDTAIVMTYKIEQPLD